MMQTVEVIKLPHYEEMEDGTVDVLEMPSGHYTQSAGIDLRAAIPVRKIVLEPGEDYVIPSGLKIHIGSHPLNSLYSNIGIYGMIVPRSGLGFKHYTRLANTAGIIDADYQGEIMIKIRNEGKEPLTINRGDRVCQLVFHMYIRDFEFKEVEHFSADTERGSKGFASTGVK